MTEEEAKTRWCPHARQAVVTNREIGTTASANRDGGEHYGADNCNCLGSACMAWRGGLWERVDRPAAMGAPDGQGWVKDGQESGLGGAVTNRQQWKREQFFCGLAGKP